jgi:hypothetical protein
LKRDGIEVVLVGGSVAAIYSSETYVTYDLDLVHWARLSAIEASLSKLDFTMSGRLARHPETDFILDFVNSPVLIGHKYVSEDGLTTRRTRHGLFRLLSPLDCVLDRISAFYHYDDRQGLEQAVAIARKQRIPVAEIAKWSREEARSQRGRADAFDAKLEEFKRSREEKRARRKGRVRRQDR